MLENKPDRITITESFQMNGRWFLRMQQYCYTSKVFLGNAGYCKTCIIDDFVGASGWFYVVTIDSIDYNIPVEMAAYTPTFTPPNKCENYEKWLGERYEDPTVDYFTEVKKQLGIDIKRAYIPQHNGDGFIPTEFTIDTQADVEQINPSQNPDTCSTSQ